MGPHRLREPFILLTLEIHLHRRLGRGDPDSGLAMSLIHFRPTVFHGPSEHCVRIIQEVFLLVVIALTPVP